MLWDNWSYDLAQLEQCFEGAGAVRWECRNNALSLTPALSKGRGSLLQGTLLLADGE